MAGYEELERRIAALEERVKALESVRAGRSKRGTKSKEDVERTMRVKNVSERYFDYIDAAGEVDFVGKSTAEVTDEVLFYARFILKEPLDLGKKNRFRMGVQRTITNLVIKRYGIGANGGKFIAVDDVE